MYILHFSFRYFVFFFTSSLLALSISQSLRESAGSANILNDADKPEKFEGKMNFIKMEFVSDFMNGTAVTLALL